MSDSKQKLEQLEEEAKSYSGLGIEGTWFQNTTREQDKVYFEKKPPKFYLIIEFDKDWVVMDKFISISDDWQSIPNGIKYKIEPIEQR